MFYRCCPREYLKEAEEKGIEGQKWRKGNALAQVGKGNEKRTVKKEGRAKN